jgi:hypothetical protein
LAAVEVHAGSLTGLHVAELHGLVE